MGHYSIRRRRDIISYDYMVNELIISLSLYGIWLKGRPPSTDYPRKPSFRPDELFSTNKFDYDGGIPCTGVRSTEYINEVQLTYHIKRTT